MAFSNNPQYSTYRQEKVVFDGTPLFRYGDTSVQRDLQIVNLYYDRISQENKTREIRLKKRPGLTASTYSLSKVANTDPVRGSFYDVDQNAFYWVVKDKVYTYKPDVGGANRLVTTLTTTTGYVGFCSFLKSDDTRYVIFTDGTELWVDNFASTTCTKVTDADLPTPHKPYPIYLDGYLFLIEASSGNIWNSDNDDPFAWTAGNYIQAEISSDYSLRLLKSKNYLVCLGANSAEYFWNAGNVSASPLSRNDSPVRGVGYLTGLCMVGDTAYFVGQDEKQNISVFAINSFKIEKVSNPVVDRTLQTFGSTSNQKGNITLDQDGYSVSVDGHSFYVLVTPQTTWVFDVNEKMWYEWKGSDGVGLKIESALGMYNGALYLAIKNQTHWSIMSQSVYQDFGNNFTCRYTTEPLDFDTSNWKTCHRVMLGCSMFNYTGTSNAYISWSDNDWTDGGTTPRAVNTFSNSPFISRCGKFRTRSFRVEYADNYPIWFTDLELNLNVGTH